jgi:hypothetical protein
VLNGACIVKPPLQLQIRFMRRFGVIKPRFAVSNSVGHKLHSPFTLIGADTKQSNFVSFGSFSHVLKITEPSHLAQIAKTIIQLISVYVVYMLRRPFTCNVSPRQTVRELFSVMDGNRPVPGRMPSASNFTDKIGSLFVQNPCKDTCISVVTKRRSKVFNGAWRVSCHDNALTIGVAA